MRYFHVGVHIIDLIRILGKRIEEIRLDSRPWTGGGGQSDLVWIPGSGAVPVDHSLPALQPKIQRSLGRCCSLSCGCCRNRRGRVEPEVLLNVVGWEETDRQLLSEDVYLVLRQGGENVVGELSGFLGGFLPRQRLTW